MHRKMGSSQYAQKYSGVAVDQGRRVSGVAMARRHLAYGPSELFDKTFNIRVPLKKRRDLRHRTPWAISREAVIDDNQEASLLEDTDKCAASGQSVQKTDLLADSIERFWSACRSNVTVLLRTYRRTASFKYKKLGGSFRKAQRTELQTDAAIPCLGRARRWQMRKILGDIIKIEEEIVAMVPRSILYYAS